MKGRGQNFDDFMKEQNLYEQAQVLASKKVIAAMLKKEMESQHVTKTAMAKRMQTTRTAVDNLLSASFNSSIGSLEKFAFALGKKLSITLV